MKQDVVAWQGFQTNREGVSFSRELFQREQTVSVVEPLAGRGRESGTLYHIYLNFISNLFIFLTTCVILQDDSERDEVQGRAPSGRDTESFDAPSGRDSESFDAPSGRESESADDPSGRDSETPEEDLLGSTQVRRRRARRSHYVPPPPVPTNEDDRLVIRPVGDR